MPTAVATAGAATPADIGRGLPVAGGSCPRFDVLPAMATAASATVRDCDGRPVHKAPRQARTHGTGTPALTRVGDARRSRKLSGAGSGPQPKPVGKQVQCLEHPLDTDPVAP